MPNPAKNTKGKTTMLTASEIAANWRPKASAVNVESALP